MDMEDEPKPKRITIDQLAGMMANAFAEVRDQFATLENHIGNLDTRFLGVERGLNGLSYKVDQLDAKVEKHHQETKTDLAAIRGVMGGMSHTLSDHEERIKALEGE